MPPITEQLDLFSPLVDEALSGLDGADVLRLETVLSKLPIHHLNRQGELDIRIERRNQANELEFLWEVSPNPKYGAPRILAYKIDRWLVDRRIDEVRPNVPKVIRLGNMSAIAEELGVNTSGKMLSEIKKALYQNADAMITARVPFKRRDGQTDWLEARFSRYSVVMHGEKLPQGDHADGVYLILSDVYHRLLSQAPARPLNFTYLKETLRDLPSSQRWYEIFSLKMFPAIKYGHARVTMPYSEYCATAPLLRMIDKKEMMRQIRRIAQPHIKSEYIRGVEYQKLNGEGGMPDWLMSVKIGPRAYAEYRHFNSRGSLTAGRTWTDQDAADFANVLANSNTGLPVPPSPGEELVRHFLKAKRGNGTRRIYPKELQLAEKWVKRLGAETVKKLIDSAVQRAQSEGFRPHYLGGLEVYVNHEIERHLARKQEEAERSARTEDARWEAEAEVRYESLIPAEKMRREAAALTQLAGRAELADLLTDPVLKQSLSRQMAIATLALELKGRTRK